MQICTQKTLFICFYADNLNMSEQSPTLHRHPLAEITLPDREWSGELGRATKNGALFSLYLSIHCQPGSEPLRIIGDEEPPVPDDDFPARLNHYRRPALQAGTVEYQTSGVTSLLANSGAVAAFSLWQSMHPDPLSYRDNAQSIPPEVKVNCSLATQLRLSVATSNQKSVDETGLLDVIEKSNDLLSA